MAVQQGVESARAILCNNTANVISNSDSKLSFKLSFQVVLLQQDSAISYHDVEVAVDATDSQQSRTPEAPELGRLVVKVDGERRLHKDYSKAHNGTKAQYAGRVSAVTVLGGTIVAIPFVGMAVQDMYKKRVGEWREQLEAGKIRITDGVNLQLQLGWREPPQVRWNMAADSTRHAWFLDHMTIKLAGSSSYSLPKFILGNSWQHWPCPLTKKINVRVMVKLHNIHGSMPATLKLTMQDQIKYTQQACNTNTSTVQMASLSKTAVGVADAGVTWESQLTQTETRMVAAALTEMQEHGSTTTYELTLGAGAGNISGYVARWDYSMRDGFSAVELESFQIDS